jgi:hypothetical protein
MVELWIGLFLAASATLDEASQRFAQNFGWLSGDWMACQAPGSVEERWTSPYGTTMVGLNISWDGKRAQYEFLRIALDKKGMPTLYAQPSGQAAIAFAASA